MPTSGPPDGDDVDAGQRILGGLEDADEAEHQQCHANLLVQHLEARHLAIEPRPENPVVENEAACLALNPYDAPLELLLKALAKHQPRPDVVRGWCKGMPYM